MNKIKVIVIDDHILFMEGIAALLGHSESVDVVDKISDSTQALEKLSTREHDVVLLDYQMPKCNGLELLGLIKRHAISSKVIMLSTFDNHDLVKHCMKMGAMGYLRKDIDYPTLLRAIQSVNEEEVFIQPFFAGSIESEVDFSPVTENQRVELTTGELQVLKLIASGYSNIEIAEMLFKSSGRIRNIVSSLLTKMDVRDRTQAAIKGIQVGLL